MFINIYKWKEKQPLKQDSDEKDVWNSAVKTWVKWNTLTWVRGRYKKKGEKKKHTKKPHELRNQTGELVSKLWEVAGDSIVCLSGAGDDSVTETFHSCYKIS